MKRKDEISWGPMRWAWEAVGLSTVLVAVTGNRAALWAWIAWVFAGTAASFVFPWYRK